MLTGYDGRRGPTSAGSSRAGTAAVSLPGEGEGWRGPHPVRSRRRERAFTPPDRFSAGTATVAAAERLPPSRQGGPRPADGL